MENTKKIFMFFLVGLLLISMISIVNANSLSYDEETKTAKIKETFLFIPISTIAEVQLKTDLDNNGIVDLHASVGVGYVQVAEFTVNGKTDFNELFYGEIKTYNKVLYEKNNKRELEKKIDLKYKSIEDYYVDDYKCSDVTSKNGSISNECSIVGNHIEQRIVWLPFDENTKIQTDQEITIGLFTTTYEGETIEWIPSFAGVEVEQWADWSASLYNGLVGAWNLDEGTGTTVADLTGHGYTGTVTDAGDWNQTGKNGKAFNCDGTSEFYIGTNDTNGYDAFNGYGNEFAISFWLIDWEFGGNTGWVSKSNEKPEPYNFGVFTISDPDGSAGFQPYIYINGDDPAKMSLATVFSDNNYHHAVLSYSRSNSNLTFYIDEIAKGSIAVNFDNVANPDSSIRFCEIYTTNFKKMNIDNVAYWNRSLTSAEVTNLYNSGAGQPYMPLSPTVVLNSPANTTNYTTTQSVSFNGTVSTASPVNVSLMINGVVNQTNSSGLMGNYYFSGIFADGSYRWNYKTCSNTVCNLGTERNFTINTQPFIQFETPTPTTTYNSTSSYLPVNVSLTELFYKNISFNFYKNGVITTYSYTNGTRFINQSFAEGLWRYNATVWTTTGRSNTTETRVWNYDVTSPIISGTGNLTDLNVLSLPTNSSWNFTATDDHLSTCWYSNVSGGANYTVTCNSQINTTWATQGNKTLTYCANDTFGFQTCATSYIYVYLVSYAQADNPDPIAEGFDATFNLTINRTNIPVTTATLNFNGTIYTATATAGTNGYYFEKTITIPDTFGSSTGNTINWNWNYTITGVVTNQSTSTDNITVYELSIDDCSVYGEIILDLNLNDEETNALVNESAGANVEIDLTLTSKSDASVYLQYNHTWTNENNPKVCIPANVLNNSQYWIDFTIGFSSTDHVWEFYHLDDGTLNMTKIFNAQTSYQINLMDLLTADSTSFLFNYFDIDGLSVDNTIVHVFRQYIGEGAFREVERSKADQNGDTIIHLVEEDVIYYFLITRYGVPLFTSSTYTALCQATPCTIQIEASSTGAVFGTDWDLVNGGGYVLLSTASTRQINLTYALNQTSDVNLTIYKYNSDGSYSAISTTSQTASSGSIITTIPQGAGNVSFFASVMIDDKFINSEWVNFEGNAQAKFGITLSLFLGALLILTLGLMAISEGGGIIIFVGLGVIIAGFLGLITTKLSTGVSIVIYLVLAGGILLWKLSSTRK